MNIDLKDKNWYKLIDWSNGDELNHAMYVIDKFMSRENVSPEAWMEIINERAWLMSLIPENTLKQHPEIWIQSVRKRPSNIQYVPKDELEKEPNECIEAIKKRPDYTHSVPESILKQFPNVCLDLLKKEPNELRKYSKRNINIKFRCMCGSLESMFRKIIR